MFNDSGGQDLTLETGYGSATYSDLSAFPERKFKSIKDELIRSKTNSCFPEVTGDQYERLKDDIRRNGQLNPILVHGSEVVDGWTRYRVCCELGLEILVLEVSHQDGIQATLSSQFNRGSFSKLQKAAIIHDAVEMVGRGRPKKESEADPFLNDLAQRYGVSKSYLKLVSRVKREYPDGMNDIKSGKLGYSNLKDRFNQKTPMGQAAQSKTSKATLESSPLTVASAIQPDQAVKPEASTPPEPASTVGIMVDQGVQLAPIPEAIEVLKLLRHILARLSGQEKSLFKQVAEPLCDYLDIDLN